MSESDQTGEIDRLRQQVAELTRRVYRLERMAGNPVEDAATSPPFPSSSNRKVDTASQPGPDSLQPQISPVVAAGPEQKTAAGAMEKSLLASANKSGRPRVDASLESRVGGQWLNRVGIVAVLVGLSYFLKLAFENNWIGPTTQVLIGIVAGLGILFWSERFRRKGYPAFAYSLKALAVGALYLSLWAASQYYHLVPSTVSFFGMVMVTLTSAALALHQDAELLAGFALVGGFLTPILISTGENHEIALFCYVALLDLGTLWIVAMKGWRRILLGSFVGTTALFSAWASASYTEPQLVLTLVFATFFFLLYAVAPLLSRQTAPLQSSHNFMIALAMLNAATYFATSYLALVHHHRLELAWLSLGTAVFFFLLAGSLRGREDIAGPVYSALHLALGIGFLTVAIPLKLDGYWVTLGWLVEAGALFWAAHHGRSLLLRTLGACALALGIFRLIAIDNFERGPLLLNARFALYLTAIAALALLAYCCAREDGQHARQWTGAAIIAINLLALLALHFEVAGYFEPHFATAYFAAERSSVATIQAFTYSAIWMMYGSGLMLIGFWKRSAFLRWQAIVLLALTAAKVFFYDISALERGYRIAAFIVLGVILLAVSFFYQRTRAKSSE